MNPSCILDQDSSLNGLFPKIRALAVFSGTNAAPSAVTYTPPSFAGTYRVSCYLDATTATTLTFKNKLTYTDPAGNATTDKPAWQRQGNATMVAQPTANTADRFGLLAYVFGVDASGGTITIADDAGTYTTCVYRYTVVLEQLA